ncbi:MAG: hypothetical protein IPL61_28370 [Myxococcales bacterium]|nr:hypothetical protein [Myxococcales bacterium]
MKIIQGALLALVMAACGGSGGDGSTDAGDGLSTVATIPAVVNRDLDLLFVVDNSGSMIEEQIGLAANFQAMTNVLYTLTGGLANLHLGVVSTNVGTGGVNIGGCSSASRPEGDDGNLQTNGCAGLTAPYLEDLKNPDGTRARNYSGDLNASSAAWPASAPPAAASSSRSSR